MEGFLTFGNVMQIVVYTVTVISIYWKMRIDIANINLQIEELKCDRSDRWSRQDKKWELHDEKQDKSDAYFTDILRGIGDLRGDIKVVKETISWLKKTK